MILHAKRYLPESVTILLWRYALKDFVEQLNLLEVNYDGINPMEKFAGTTTDITL